MAILRKLTKAFTRILLKYPIGDRKSTRLNSSHDQISYAVFCLKKKKTENRGRRDDVRPVNQRFHIQLRPTSEASRDVWRSHRRSSGRPVRDDGCTNRSRAIRAM